MWLWWWTRLHQCCEFWALAPVLSLPGPWYWGVWFHRWCYSFCCRRYLSLPWSDNSARSSMTCGYSGLGCCCLRCCASQFQHFCLMASSFGSGLKIATFAPETYWGMFERHLHVAETLAVRAQRTVNMGSIRFHFDDNVGEIQKSKDCWWLLLLAMVKGKSFKEIVAIGPLMKGRLSVITLTLMISRPESYASIIMSLSMCSSVDVG